MAMNTTTWSKTVGLTDYEKPMKVEAAKGSEVWNYPDIFTMGKMNKAGQMKFYHYTGLGVPNLRTELQPVVFNQGYELGDYTITAVKYALGFVISEEWEEDNTQIQGLLKKMTSSVGTGMSNVDASVTASVFDNAFDTTNYPGWDSKAMCDSHTANDGTAIDNDLGPTSISKDTLWDMVRYFDYQIYDEAGLEVNDMPWRLVTHPTNRETLEKILKSPLESDTGDNNANTLKDKGLKACYCRKQSSTTSFFVLGKKMKEHLLFMVKKPLTVKWKDAFEVIGRKCRNHKRIGYGFTDYRFIVGNPGA